MALLEVENLTYYYGGAGSAALSGVNLEINAGEFVLLVGRSGGGKSTLLRALSGLVPDFYGGTIAGTVRYLGKSVQEWDKGKLAGEMGFIFQDPEQQLVMTGVEREIAFGMENTAVSPGEMKRRVAEVMHFLNISHLKRRNTFDLSGGQKQLVVLASVLAMQPKVLLLDEPTSQLDPVAAEEFLNNIRKLNEELGLTVVLVEQRLERCLHLAHRVLVIDEGRLVSDFPPGRAVKWELKRNSAFLPPLPRLFAAAGSAAVPLTVGEGRNKLRAMGFSGADCPVKAVTPEANNKCCRAEKLLEVKNVFYTYPGSREPAVEGVDMAVENGEFIAVIGENGGGKSTLLKTICGLLRPQRGKISICGEDISKKSVQELAGTVGYLSQNPNDYLFHDTVWEEVAFGLTVRGIKAGDTVEEILEKLRLTGVKDINPRDLSGGERQRVALASVLVLKPRLLLLDEPTRGLDAYLKEELGSLLLSLVAEGVSVIMVTHDIEFIAEYAGRVMIVFDGEVVADGDKRQVLNNSLYYAPQVNKLFRGFYEGVITFQEALNLLKRCNYEVD
ncbi:energy-coupling factor transport system ATP-binding protein [Desulfohalotomaculum tongense]|uniref:ABC transporter ATP-binding protein n=1 Tax=Desulforadius tongensis TaxID=1216062 RepID=UPI00195ADB5B|nr:ABC transporter ATP-binding protein [Desulforadius tongensis]MBM7853922.1 energy-coupling factor transport system ATP-binding protein [Desulforadius tongensis]